ncbi:N-hydroxyarylamine O-acetyltransferase [Alteraurantiacibacter aestuarii]|uniref:Arylamine N-acetyltransferase n=1 Tax=Alteraurantiacibacter aestuarii TaxID=650004 RepID=A0A844ZNT3_9SPHN|nr:arylamine N-acetyltransferase [Alteraurantiacibacter aestuarii]MXO88716.1 arylamine N-acetyltransferase [Alteraurantiacibacter aestuarii]
MGDRLGAYCARLALDEVPGADAAGLALLQSAHRQAITFENLDVLLGCPILIGSDDVFAKLVTAGRGGYCFEQNRLYADMLALMGIASRPLLARPRLAIPDNVIPPRTHVLLLADLGGEKWLADAGFGGSYVPPLPLTDGAETRTPDGARHRLRHIGRADGDWLLERSGPRATTDGRAQPHGDWQAQYSFDLAPVAQADMDQANHWTATWPQSRFVLGPIVSRVLPGGFMALSGTSLSIAQGDQSERRELQDAQEWRAALADLFAIDLDLAQVSQLRLFDS